MKSQLQPWHLLVLILAGWINRLQQDAIEYLLTENHILREKLGLKRILLNDSRRRRLSIKGKILGRRVLDELATIATPKTGQLLQTILAYNSVWSSAGHR
jgi:hypothetical protein